LPSPSPDVKPETVFSDLDTDAPWAKTAVENLYRRGIISGRGEGIFDPNADITREEFAKIIVLAAGLEITGEPSGFSDVPSGSWAEPYIAAAKNSGIINGKSEDEFGSGQNITREEMAAMVYRMIVRTGFSGEKGSLDFVDAEDISGYAIEAALYLSNARIINGMDGRFEPKSNSTRAQASQIVYNAIIR
jgi:hypothetical protein